MELFTRANKISKYNMCIFGKTFRNGFLLLVVFLCISEHLYDIVVFCKDKDIGVTPFAFVFVINNFQIQFVIMACSVMIFSNAPFEDQSYLYLVSRAGRFSWGIGQIMYIMKLSAIYVFCLLVATIVPFIGHMQWVNEWGKIWGTLARTNTGAEYSIKLFVSSNIMHDYSPVKALVISISLEFACVMFIGLVVYLGNRLTGKAVGTIIGAIITVLDVCIANDWMDWAYGFSPVSLTQLELFYGYASRWGINIKYATSFFMMSLIVLGILCIASNYKEKANNNISRRR